MGIYKAHHHDQDRTHSLRRPKIPFTSQNIVHEQCVDSKYYSFFNAVVDRGLTLQQWSLCGITAEMRILYRLAFPSDGHLINQFLLPWLTSLCLAASLKCETKCVLCAKYFCNCGNILFYALFLIELKKNSMCNNSSFVSLYVKQFAEFFFFKVFDWEF